MIIDVSKSKKFNKDDKSHSVSVGQFGKILNIPLTEKTKSVWYPHKEQDDTKNVEFTDE